MRTVSLRDGGEAFEVTLLDAERPARVVLFAVGGGGDPGRHAPLLAALAARGSVVVAPHFERLVSPAPSDDHLLLRARRLGLALGAAARPGVPVAGVGHSIGATMLLALAGAQVWTRAGRALAIAADGRIERLALMAPATGFFQAPGALDAVRAPLRLWAAQDDAVTPPESAAFLARALDGRAPVDLRVAPGAGHFSFMHAPPPHATDALPDRDAFLARLATDICDFVAA